MALCLGASACLCIFAGRAQASDGLSTDWLAYGGNAQLTNYVAAPPGWPATPHAVAWTTELDGAIYASPVAVGAVSTPSGVHDVAVVGTEAGSIYAVDIHTGAVIWKRTYPTEVTHGCGNWGVTSSGAVDKQLGVVYIVTARGFLHAFQLSTGADAPGWPIRITLRPGAEYVWGGLRIVNSRVYVGVASYCDIPDPTQGLAEGRLVGVSETNPTDQVQFDPVPGGNNLGGIWGYGGISTDVAGDTVYTGTGNSSVQDPTCNCTVEVAGYGDDLVALTPDLSQVVGVSRPPYIPKVGDADFGAAPLVFKPRGCPPLLAMNNKNGNLFVWNRLKIGSGVIAHFGIGDSQEAFLGQPSWDPLTQTMYDSHATVEKNGKDLGDGIAAIAVTKGCSFKQTWLTRTGSGEQLPPLVIGNTVYDGAGNSPGIVALNALTGKVVWSWGTTGTALLSTPLIETDGLIIAGDTSGALRAFS